MAPSETDTAQAPEPFEVLTMGRIGVDIYPLQTGVGLEDVETFGKYLGGSASNVAVAAARYGHRTAVITRTGDDPFGRFLHRALRGYGVDDRFVTPVPRLPTPVTFCEIFPPDDFPIYFYREPKAPDLEIDVEELDFDAIRQAGIFWVTVTGLCQEPSRSATLAALESRAKAGVTVLDLDYRPMFWESREEARHWVREALPFVTVAVGNLDECDTAVGERRPGPAAKALLEFGLELAVVKQGPEGVLAVDADGATLVVGNQEEMEMATGLGDPEAAADWLLGQGVSLAIVKLGPHGVFAATPTERVRIPPIPVRVLCGLGAGDAFGGALCHGLLNGWDITRTMRFANAAGAIVASRLACSDAMPTSAEVEAALATGTKSTETHDVR
jgi:5-dehydro-2-deoxygluconokinase